MSVTLSWLPVAPLATKVSTVPSTVMVSPATKLVGSESLGAVPECGAVVIGAGVAAWFRAAEPVTVLSPNGVGGVPSTNGFCAKSDGLRPPAAVSVPAIAVLLAVVAGVVGRFAAY